MFTAVYTKAPPLALALKKMNVECGHMLMTRLSNKCHRPCANGSLIKDIKSNAKY
jgi:hypothetical protein